jgi:hypothetical protein
MVEECGLMRMIRMVKIGKGVLDMLVKSFDTWFYIDNFKRLGQAVYQVKADPEYGRAS